MRIAIIIKSGPAVGRRIVLRGGQIARIGRTDAADLPLPEDPELADIHFTVHSDGESAFLNALVQDRETRINGVPILRSGIRNGDLIEAGSSRFQVEIEGAKETVTESPAGTSPDAKEAAKDLQAISEYVGLSEKSIELSKSATDPNSFGERLVRESLLTDAIRWYAYVIPKPQAVLWACDCVEEAMRDQPDPVQQAAYKAAKRWGSDPSDENREQAKQLAEQAKYEGIGGALVAAAGWSGGSLAPAHLEAVPPDDRLTARCVGVALALADGTGSPKDSPVRLLSYLHRLPNDPLNNSRR